MNRSMESISFERKNLTIDVNSKLYPHYFFENYFQIDRMQLLLKMNNSTIFEKKQSLTLFGWTLRPLQILQ